MNEDIPDTVKTEDKQMVLDILRVIQGLTCFNNYNLNVAPKGYELLAWLKKDEDGNSEVFYDDLSLVEQACTLFSCSHTLTACAGQRVTS
jgi:hypothetical protein